MVSTQKILHVSWLMEDKTHRPNTLHLQENQGTSTESRLYQLPGFIRSRKLSQLLPQCPLRPGSGVWMSGPDSSARCQSRVTARPQAVQVPRPKKGRIHSPLNLTKAKLIVKIPRVFQWENFCWNNSPFPPSNRTQLLASSIVIASNFTMQTTPLSSFLQQSASG